MKIIVFKYRYSTEYFYRYSAKDRGGESTPDIRQAQPLAPALAAKLMKMFSKWPRDKFHPVASVIDAP